MGVFDPDHKVLEKISAEQDCVAFKSLEDLARSCEAVLSTPTDLHAEVSIPIMQGLPCFNRKPLCVNLQEAEKILEVAQQNSSIIQVGHIEHYNPVMTFLEKAVKLPKYLTVERLAPFQTIGTSRSCFGFDDS